MFEKKGISIILGGPASGKTTYAINKANELQEAYGNDVLFITLENIEEGLKNLYGKELKFKIQSLANADLNSIKKIIKTECVESKSNNKIKVVFIDYLQLISVECENRVKGCAKIIEELNELAETLDIHIAIVSQAARSSDRKTAETPSYINEIIDKYKIIIINV